MILSISGNSLLEILNLTETEIEPGHKINVIVIYIV